MKAKLFILNTVLKIKDFAFKQDDYLPKHKVGIEIDEYDHVDSDPKYEKERRKLIKDHGITVIRTNPDAEQSTKKSLINDLSKRLLRLEFKLNHSIKSKWIKMGCQKNTANNIRHEKHTIKNKTNKEWKKSWNNVLFRV